MTKFNVVLLKLPALYEILAEIKLELNFNLISFDEKNNEFKKFIEENPEVLVISPDLKENFKNFIPYNKVFKIKNLIEKINIYLSKSNYEKLLNNFCNVTDVSDHYHFLNLSGDKLRWILSKGCSVDLNKSVFRPGSCVQTLLGNSNVILTCNFDNSINLICVSSYIEYVLGWLKDAANQEGYFFLIN